MRKRKGKLLDTAGRRQLRKWCFEGDVRKKNENHDGKRNGEKKKDIRETLKKINKR